DGIRDFHVTGVQTCALPICLFHLHFIRILVRIRLIRILSGKNADQADADKDSNEVEVKQAATDVEGMLREGPGKYAGDKYDEERSEERRVGQESRPR